MAHRQGDYLLVAGLDFGTTFSGYAFSFKDDPEKIICNKNWGASLGFQSYKTPSTILTNGADEFITMGYDADQQYNEQAEEGRGAANLHLYRHFKMILHKSKEVRLKAVVTSEDGTIRPAVKIFGYAIEFLRKHIIQAIQAKTATELDPSRILWVITVPAIWSEPSKKFMREAAKRGGCVSDVNAKNLILALEPEAASLCCRRPSIAGYRSEEGLAFPPDTQYLIIDCGGGTIDITAHKTLEGEKIEEVLPASGGPWGGMYVDREFSHLMEEIFGKDFLKRYKAKYPQGWLELISSFETTKKPFNAADKSVLRVKVPWSFGDFHAKSKRGKDIQVSIKKFKNPDVSFTNGTIVVQDQTAKDLFTPVLDQIMSHVRDLVRSPGLRDCKYIFMVGGFSESQLLQDEMKERFGKKGTKVLIPSETQLAVLKGAVLFGHFQTEITSRIARKSYGHGGSLHFDPAIHDQSKKFEIEDGQICCRNIFVTLIEQGESIVVGEEITRISLRSSITEQEIRIFSIDGKPKHPVQYTDSPEVEFLGKVKYQYDKSKIRKEDNMIETYTFGATEIYVRVVNKATGKETSAKIDFLSDPSV